ncbi:MAG: Gx transporter family protein [Oscillospiraceae bacterium]|jgi:heptaprenyl diphosphate synthase|nr:Gx transporter family protein [Oscillospiraceae bacterium]
MSRTRKLATAALLASLALVLHMAEAALPPLVAIPGIKLGLANVVTLFAMVTLGIPCAAGVLAARIFVGGLLGGGLSAMLYGAAGGLASFALMSLLCRKFQRKRLWIVSALCAVAHNYGQLAVAIAVTGRAEIIWYAPVLTAVGIIAGALTGVCATLVLNRLEKARK